MSEEPRECFQCGDVIEGDYYEHPKPPESEKDINKELQNLLTMTDEDLSDDPSELLDSVGPFCSMNCSHDYQRQQQNEPEAADE